MHNLHIAIYSILWVSPSQDRLGAQSFEGSNGPTPIYLEPARVSTHVRISGAALCIFLKEERIFQLPQICTV